MKFTKLRDEMLQGVRNFLIRKKSLKNYKKIIKKSEKNRKN